MNKNSLEKYYNQNLVVLPIKKVSEKVPKFPNWQQITKLSQIPDFALNDFEAIGLLAGVSGCLIIDIDVKNDPSGAIGSNYMGALEMSFDQYDDLLIQKTPSGGFHIIFKMNDPPGNKVLARYKTGVVIETRGSGGQALIDPSPGYEIIQGSFDSLIKLSTDDVNFLLNIATTFNKVENKPKSTPKTSTDDDTPFKKFNREKSIVELLTFKGWAYVEDNKLGSLVLRPGESKAKHSGIVFSNSNIFYCHSTSTDFKPETAYTAYDVALVLGYDEKQLQAHILNKHGDDYTQKITYKTLDFPLDVFPEKIQSYMKEQNDISNFDINLMAATFLWTASVMIGNKASFFVSETWDSSPVMWLMVIAERGSTKTHAMKAITHPIKQIESKNRKQYEQDIKGWSKDSSDPKPRWNQIFLEDGTREGFTKAMNHNPGGLGLLKDELHGWLADMDKHSGSKGGDESFWLSSYNNSSYSKNIKLDDDPAHVERMFISLTGSIQPKVMQEINENHTSNGLFDRFLLLPYEDAMKPFKLFIKTPDHLEFYYAFMKFVYSTLNDMYLEIGSQSFHLKEDATKPFEDAYNYFLTIRRKEEDVNVKAYIAKIVTYLPRIALIIEIIDQLYLTRNLEMSVSKSSINKAKDVLKYFLNNARRVLFNANINIDVKDIIKDARAIKKTDKILALLRAIDAKEVPFKKADIPKLIGISKQLLYKVNKKYQGLKVNKTDKVNPKNTPKVNQK